MRRIAVAGVVGVLLLGLAACGREEEPAAIDKYREAFSDEQTYTGHYVLVLRTKIAPTEAEIEDFIAKVQTLNDWASGEDILPLFYLRISRNVIQLIYGAQNHLYGIRRDAQAKAVYRRLRERYPDVFWLKIR